MDENVIFEINNIEEIHFSCIIGLSDSFTFLPDWKLELKFWTILDLHITL